MASVDQRGSKSTIILSGLISANSLRCISEHRVVYDVNIPVWAIPHLCKRVIPSSTCLKIRFAAGTEMNSSCRVSKVFSRLQLNSSVTRQRCSLSSSKPGWTNWFKRLAQWLFGVTDDKRWRTSSSRSLCSRFKPVAYPVRILMATCTLSLEDSVNNPAAPKKNPTCNLEQARHLTLYQIPIWPEAWSDDPGQMWVLGHPESIQSLPMPVSPEALQRS